MTDQIRRYSVKITGTQPLLMHADNIEWADQMDVWKAQAANKKNSKAGDDRSPAWRWLGTLYHDGSQIIIPSDNVMRCLMEGGAMVPVPGGKNGKTFKAQTQSGIMPSAMGWPLLVGGNPIAFAPLEKLGTVGDFEAHKAAAKAAGFELFLKRVKIGPSKHIRVRPRFDSWSLTADLLVADDQITTPILQTIFDYAGRYKGLCDWRASSKTPGPFGMFRAEVTEAA